MADIIQQRRDTAARWSQYNPILLEGEVGYVTDNPNQYKIGNGRDRWNDLPFRGYTGTITQDTGDDENAVMSQKATTEKLSELGSEVEEIGGKPIDIVKDSTDFIDMIYGGDGVYNSSEEYNGILIEVKGGQRYSINGNYSRYDIFDSMPTKYTNNGHLRGGTEPIFTVPNDGKYILITVSLSNFYSLTLSKLGGKVFEIEKNIGDLTKLNTKNKDNVVGALNEVEGKFKTIEASSIRYVKWETTEGGESVSDELTRISNVIGSKGNSFTLEAKDYIGIIYDGTNYTQATAQYNSWSFFMSKGQRLTYKEISGTINSYRAVEKKPVFGEKPIILSNYTENGFVADRDLYILLTVSVSTTPVMDIALSGYGLVNDIEPKNKLGIEGKNIVFLGDSIVQGVGASSADNRYPQKIGSIFNCNVYNGGIGGTHISARVYENDLNIYWKKLDVANIATYIASGDWTVAKEAATALQNAGQGYPPYGAIYNVLSKVDWNNIDIIAISGGSNDWTSGKIIGNTDSSNIEEFMGGINHIVKSILSTYPHIEIIFISNLVRYHLSQTSQEWGSVKDIDGHTLEDFADAMVKGAMYNTVPCYDLYHDCGLTKYNFTDYFSDNAHPNDKGYDVVARKVGKYIDKICR